MLKPEQIPEAVVKAFEEEYHFGEGNWKRNVIAAALNAWPGAIHNGHWLLYPHTKLPLSPKETEKSCLIPEYNADRGEQRTICEACGNANLAHKRAKWTGDGSSYCPPCLPKETSDA